MMPKQVLRRDARRDGIGREAAVTTIKATCPSCRDSVRKPADDHIVSLLMSGGVRAEVWEVPAEAIEPKTGPELDYDDLLDFVLQLSRDDMLAARATIPARR